ncbi:MAG: outer membrane protein transport protein [Bacteroidetes bacterium]|nr:outer membrane protein transport protein [Bacteroidota bacterium]
MKSIKLIIVFLFVSTALFAQNEVDALRYSQNFYGGTARYMSMGGAFGALGGDLSALSFNPAGIGVFRSSKFSFTPSLNYNEASSKYYGNNLVDNAYNMNLNNIGYVKSINTEQEQTGWMNINYAIGYNRINDFNQNVIIEGVNSNSSLLDYYVDAANSTNKDIQSQADLFINSDLIYKNPETGYVSDYLVDGHYGELQNKSIRTKGRMGEYYFSFGANYTNKLYLGATFGYQSVLYEENTDYSEIDINNNIQNLVSFNYHNHLITKGNGFNFKFGAIYKPIYWMRIGAAVHTPTFFDLTDEYSSSVDATIDYVEGTDINTSEKSNQNYNYQLTTPAKFIGSLAFVIKKTAIISVDYEYIDYSSSRLRADDYTFTNENANVSTRYTATGNLKLGAEYKFGPFNFRGGYAYYGSPYVSSEANHDATYSIYSGGFGISQGNYSFDLAFLHSTQSQKYYLYSEHSSEVNLDSKSNIIMATLGIKF